MAHWLFTLNIKDEWQQCTTELIENYQLAEVISERLTEIAESSNFPDYFSQDIEEVIELFNDFAESKTDDNEWFNEIMEDLYNLGDCEYKPSNTIVKNKLIWIKTSF